MKHTGRCHCGSVKFEFEHDEILSGIRCNCSLCSRKGAIMTAFTLSPGEIQIEIKNDSLSTYKFRDHVAKHHFCKNCGIYTFHQTLKKPGHYRVNLGCIEGIDSMNLPFDVFDGASL